MKKYYLIAFAATLMAFSCQRIAEVVTPEETQPSDVKMITVSCTLPDTDPDSKVTLVNDGTKGKTSWVNGDEVFFHGKKVGSGYSYVAAAHDVSADGKTAYFTIPDLSEKYDGGEYYRSSLFAAYPASAIADYSDGAKWYYLSGFKNTNTLLLAGCNDFDPSKNEYEFKFFNLTGAISFKVDGSSFGGFDKYVFQGNNGETIGWDNHSVSFATLKSDGSVEERYRYKGSTGPGASSGAKTSITVTPASGWDNGTTVNTIYFPGTGEYDKGAANFTGGFTIKFYKGEDEVKRVSTKTAKNITIGKLLDLGDITSHLYTYVPPATHDSSIDMTGATDLSASASANCYIVNAGDDDNANKVFKFKAYKGKSTVGVGTINSVVVLWATYNTDTAPSATTELINAVDYDKQAENDYYEVCFKMPSTLKAGNAVIAAKDKNDVILWSWHIWLPSSDVTSSNYGLTDADQVWMDRNLGALTVTVASADADAAPSSFGLFYAWGRKDPFPGLCSHASSSLIATTGSFTMNGSVMSVAESYSAPTTMVATGADENFTWTTDTPTSSLWGSSKTVNDPCPPGYKVPAFVNGKGLWSGASGTGFAVNSTHHWFKMGTDPFIVFPIVGYIDGNKSTAVNVNRADRVYVWSSTATSDDGLSYNLRVNAAGTSSNEWQRQARAGSIRCVAE